MQYIHHADFIAVVDHGKVSLALDAKVILTPPCIFH
jgi:hypothetical protein